MEDSIDLELVRKHRLYARLEERCTLLDSDRAALSEAKELNDSFLTSSLEQSIDGHMNAIKAFWRTIKKECSKPFTPPSFRGAHLTCVANQGRAALHGN